MTEIASKLRKLRLIQLVLIAAIPILGYIAEMGRPHGLDNWTARHWLVAAVALWGGWVGLRYRHRMTRRSLNAFAKDASDPKALRQWEVANLVALTMAEGVAYWGLVVRMVLKGSLWQASLFYAAGLFLLFLWTPRLPITPASD